MKIKGLYTKKGWFCYQPPTNSLGIRPKPIALRTKDPQEAIELYYEAQERHQLAAAAVDGRMDQAIDLYLQAKKAAREHSPKTTYITEKALRQICRELGNPKLGDLTKSKIEAWADNLRARKCMVAIRGSRKSNSEPTIRNRARTSVSDSTVASYSRALKAFLNWLYETGKTLHNVSNAAPKGSCKKTRKMRFTTFDQRDKLLDTTTRSDVALILHLGFLAGMRFGEILAMQPDWLWFSESGRSGSIRVQETEFWKPKDKEAREIPMPPRLLKYLKILPMEGKFLLKPEKSDFPPAPKYRYNPLTTFQKHAALCDVPWLTYHDMRHSYASHLIQRGATLAEVAMLLGDEISVCERHYAGLMPARHNLAKLL